MKLTDIDLSSLAEVGDALTLLESVHQRLATGGVPLPSLPEFVVNPATAVRDEAHRRAGAILEAEMQQAFFAEHAPNREAVERSARAALAADAEKLHGLGVDPMSGRYDPNAASVTDVRVNDMPVAAWLQNVTPGQTGALDAATVFGTATLPGAPAQSAAPLPQLAPSTAGAAPSQTAPTVLPASGVLPALQALAPLPVASAAAPAASAPHLSPVSGVELDADGLPWHESIHAGTKRKNADGRWTAKRGINDPDLVPRVVAQLRAQMAAGGVTAPCALVQVAKDSFQTPQPAPHVTAQLREVSAPAQSAAPLPAPAVRDEQPAYAFEVRGPAPAVTLAPVSLMAATQTLGVLQQSLGAKPDPTNHQDFMTAMTVEVLSGRLPASAFVEACQPYGGEAALRTNPAPIPLIMAALRSKYPGML